jgi:hypothetical protein
MREQTGKITELMVTNTKSGKLSNARMLRNLADEKTGSREALKLGPLRSLALELTAEPQWQSPADSVAKGREQKAAIDVTEG